VFVVDRASVMLAAAALLKFDSWLESDAEAKHLAATAEVSHQAAAATASTLPA